MSRYFGTDVIKAVNTQLVNNLPAAITTINTTRSTSAEAIQQFTYSTVDKQFPVCFTEITDSEVLDNEGELNNDIEREIELYNGQTTVMVRESKSRGEFVLDMEIYEEAVKKTLHGYSESTKGSITWLITTATSRDEVYPLNNMSYRSVTIQWIARVN